MNVALVVMLGIAVLVIPWYFLSERAMYREKRKRFSDREDIDPSELYARFYADSGLPRERVVEVLMDVAEQTGMPVGRLRPSDRFSEELSPMVGWEFDDGAGILNWKAVRRARELVIGGDIPEIRTLDEYVRFMAAPR